MKAAICGWLFGLVLVPAMGAQSASPPKDVTVSLRCEGVQSKNSAKTVHDNAFGFGNPTAPEKDVSRKFTNRTVLVELHGATGRIYLPPVLLAPAKPPVAGAWFTFSRVEVSADSVNARFDLPQGPRTFHVDRTTGKAEIQGNASGPVEGTCRIATPERLF